MNKTTRPQKEPPGASGRSDRAPERRGSTIGGAPLNDAWRRASMKARTPSVRAVERRVTSSSMRDQARAVGVEREHLSWKRTRVQKLFGGPSATSSAALARDQSEHRGPGARPTRARGPASRNVASRVVGELQQCAAVRLMKIVVHRRTARTPDDSPRPAIKRPSAFKLRTASRKETRSAGSVERRGGEFFLGHDHHEAPDLIERKLAGDDAIAIVHAGHHQAPDELRPRRSPRARRRPWRLQGTALRPPPRPRRPPAPPRIPVRARGESRS